MLLMLLIFNLATAAVLWHENYNLQEIVTPVNANKFEQLLLETEYCPRKTRFLINGFKNGFSLCFEGNREVTRYAPNLKIRVGSKEEIWNKVMKEVAAKRYAGPYTEVPFKHFMQSPIGLVPKDKGTKTRLIFHLSYPRNGHSVNSGISRNLCTVKYPEFTDAVQLCKEIRVGSMPIYIGKSDMSMAFRHVPMQVRDFCLLVLKATHPTTGRLYFFVDKCLPFGSSISCAIFQEISSGIAHIYMVRVQQKTVNYLDDFFFAALLKNLCDTQVDRFIQICGEIQFPVSLEKTVWGRTRMSFLGYLLDTDLGIVCIPVDKVCRALEMIEYFLSRKKVTVHEVQKLCGFLNFLCRCVIPGRAFTRRLYALMAGNPALKPHHHVKVKSENKLDLQLWKEFLTNQNVFCRPFADFSMGEIDDVLLYSDASGNFRLGFGAWSQWGYLQEAWDWSFCTKARPSIEYLELFAVTAGVLVWIKHFKNRKINLFCDNESCCKMINNSSSTCKQYMILLRIITLKSLIYNVRIFAKHVKTADNGVADALSRFQTKRFKRLIPMESFYGGKFEMPSEIWPMDKIWFV